MKRLSVDCTTLRAPALTTPTTLESLDAGLTQTEGVRSARLDTNARFCIFPHESSVGVVMRFVGRLNCRVLSARVDWP